MEDLAESRAGLGIQTSALPTPSHSSSPGFSQFSPQLCLLHSFPHILLHQLLHSSPTPIPQLLQVSHSSDPSSTASSPSRRSSSTSFSTAPTPPSHSSSQLSHSSALSSASTLPSRRSSSTSFSTAPPAPSQSSSPAFSELSPQLRLFHPFPQILLNQLFHSSNNPLTAPPSFLTVQPSALPPPPFPADPPPPGFPQLPQPHPRAPPQLSQSSALSSASSTLSRRSSSTSFSTAPTTPSQLLPAFSQFSPQLCLLHPFPQIHLHQVFHSSPSPFPQLLPSFLTIRAPATPPGFLHWSHPDTLPPTTTQSRLLPKPCPAFCLALPTGHWSGDPNLPWSSCEPQCPEAFGLWKEKRLNVSLVVPRAP
ncbi:PREDICTED: formin-like protein 6 [Myotis brandtii]|uniref:formin-like protein 6 n=1 Tax=Myotis brandtii TaxID=109478 RepID=UPI000704055D|nr:PREDICTED: formin-like protein 6 [Myotis brandtii]